MIAPSQLIHPGALRPRLISAAFGVLLLVQLADALSNAVAEVLANRPVREEPPPGVPDLLQDDDVLDRAMVDDLRSLGARDFEEMVALYLADAAELRDRIGEALAAEDLVTVAALAHQLKGSSLGFGARGVATVAAELDVAARAGRVDAAAHAALDVAVADACAAFAQELAGV